MLCLANAISSSRPFHFSFPFLSFSLSILAILPGLGALKILPRLGTLKRCCFVAGLRGCVGRPARTGLAQLRRPSFGSYHIMGVKHRLRARAIREARDTRASGQRKMWAWVLGQSVAATAGTSFSGAAYGHQVFAQRRRPSLGTFGLGQSVEVLADTSYRGFSGSGNP